MPILACHENTDGKVCYVDSKLPLQGCPLRNGVGPKISPQLSRRVAVAAALPQYAGKGVAFDCLSQGLNMNSSTGLPVDTTWLQVKAGELTCGGADAVTAQGPTLLGTCSFGKPSCH